MKLKKYLTLGIGTIAILILLFVGVWNISPNFQNSANKNESNNTTTTNTQRNSYIGEEKAKSIMLDKVPGATIEEFEFENDETPEYEAELIKDGKEYEISVDAITGEIKYFDDKDDDDDRYDDNDDKDDDDDRYDD